MLSKIVAVFLIFIVAIAVFGKLGWLGRQVGIRRRPGRLSDAGKCPSCGRPQVGRGACPCGHRG
jgi:hypothetical protein